MQPKALIFAGANGAGKTTFARNVLPDGFAPPHVGSFSMRTKSRIKLPNLHLLPLPGGELLRRLAEHVARTGAFAIETTLSSARIRREPDSDVAPSGLRGVAILPSR